MTASLPIHKHNALDRALALHNDGITMSPSIDLGAQFGSASRVRTNFESAALKLTVNNGSTPELAL